MLLNPREDVCLTQDNYHDYFVMIYNTLKCKYDKTIETKSTSELKIHINENTETLTIIYKGIVIHFFIEYNRYWLNIRKTSKLFSFCRDEGREYLYTLLHNNERIPELDFRELINILKSL